MNGWILNMQCCTTCFLIRHPKTRKHNMLHVERSERSSRACESVQSWLNLKAPTTAQWTAVTLLLSHARPLQRLSAWCQAQCFLLRASSLRPLASMERYSWTSQALCSRICDLDSRDLHFVCCCTGMNIRIINYMHVYYSILFSSCNTWEYRNTVSHSNPLSNCST